MRTILMLGLISLKLIVACLTLSVVGEPLSGGGRQRHYVNLGYQCIMRHMRHKCQVYGHTHCRGRWFPLVEACLNVCYELERADVVGCLSPQPLKLLAIRLGEVWGLPVDVMLSFSSVC